MKLRNKLLLVILFLVLISSLTISLALYFTSVDILKEQIKKAHYEKVSAVDSLIFLVISDMTNIAFTTAPKIAELINKNDYENLKEQLVLIDQMNIPGVGTGRGLGYQIVITTDREGNVLARSNTKRIIEEGKIKTIETNVSQTGNIIGDWNPSPIFQNGFEMAKEGKMNSRKIIYDEYFIRREGYGHLIDEYGFKEMMGLTTQMPILNQEKEQVGILFIITILNNNQVAVEAINIIAEAEFTAITPDGEIVSSYFVNPPEITSEIIEKAKVRVKEMQLEKKEIRGKDTVFYTKERIYLKSCPGIIIFKEGKGICEMNGKNIPWNELDTKPYRFHFVAEVDPITKDYVSIRGIAYDLIYFDELVAAHKQSSGIVLLITTLIISGLSLMISQKITAPILKFTKEIKKIEEEFGKKIDIKTKDEIEELANAFNNMSEKLAHTYKELKDQKDILEVKVKARTRELEGLTKDLEQRVEERTKKLQIQLDELEKFHKLTVGRELKMMELKKEVEKLNNELEMYKTK